MEKYRANLLTCPGKRSNTIFWARNVSHGWFLYLKWFNDRREMATDLVLNYMRPDSPLRPYDDAAHG